MANHYFSIQPQPRVNETRFPVAMRGLIQVHEIHVNLAPRQVAVKLRVQMEERLAQNRQSANPHLGRGESVHPENQASAVGGAIGFNAKGSNFLRSRHRWLPNQFKREPLRTVELLDNLLRVCRHLVQGFPAIQVLAAGDIPNLGGLQVFHIFRDSGPQNGDFSAIPGGKTEGHQLSNPFPNVNGTVAFGVWRLARCFAGQ
jgi:hypothetical protein